MRTFKLFLAASIFIAACATVNAQDHHDHSDCKHNKGKVEAKKVDSPDKAEKNSKNKKVVTFNVNMHCHACQQKVEKNIPWEKGVKDLKVDLTAKTVKITYDPKKTTEENLKKAIEKLDFTCEIDKQS
ncbi:MAG: heavy-metal-associated domain-containing protein [Prevotellaceae bacterium]|nr:heavy-metal-associated domain-containing protein [Prevotellaceae bacterium]